MLILRKLLNILYISGQIATEADVVSKFKTVFAYGLIGTITGIFSSAEDWILINRGYLNAMAILVAMDFLARLVVDFKNRKGDIILKLKATILDLTVKVFSIFALGVAIEGLPNLGVDNPVTPYIMLLARMMIYAYPLLTLSYHVSVITNGKLPNKAWFKKWDSFNDTLDVNIFNPKQQNYNTEKDEANQDEIN